MDSRVWNNLPLFNAHEWISRGNCVCLLMPSPWRYPQDLPAFTLWLRTKHSNLKFKLANAAIEWNKTTTRIIDRIAESWYYVFTRFYLHQIQHQMFLQQAPEADGASSRLTKSGKVDSPLPISRGLNELSVLLHTDIRSTSNTYHTTNPRVDAMIYQAWSSRLDKGEAGYQAHLLLWQKGEGCSSCLELCVSISPQSSSLMLPHCT